MFPLEVHHAGADAHDENLHYIMSFLKSRSLVPPTLDELGEK